MDKHTSSHPSSQLSGSTFPTIFATPPLFDPMDFANAFPYSRYWSFKPGLKASRLSIDTAPLGPLPPEIQSRSSPLSSSDCAEGAVLESTMEPVNGGTSTGEGCKRLWLVDEKVEMSLEGIPASMDHWFSMRGWRCSGSVVRAPGKMTRTCHGEDGDSSDSFERLVGVMIHRITLAVTRGSRRGEVAWTAARKVGMDVLRLRRKTEQTGIFAWCCSCKDRTV